MTIAEINRMEISQIKYPKSTNTLVKNDFFHRITTIDLMIAYEERVNTTGCTPLFFDHYFDTNSSQVKNGFQCKTRIALGGNEFISPDCIFAYQHQNAVNLFILEISNGLDTKRIVEQLGKNLTASYK